jgi:3-deoxy-manno-octulosonate cytidylyltransferase (CMP-KDO synthetase)
LATGQSLTLQIVAVIPARFSSVRFPGKPLADLAGRPLVQWVYDAALSCPSFQDVIVATESEVIAERVREFGGQVEMTSPEHPSGTDRVAEVAGRHPEAEVVVNVQGDQPFATAEMLTALVEPYLAGEAPAMTTLACPLVDPAWWDDPNVVKVVRDVEGYALYFSRSSIPHGAIERGSDVEPLHHLGLYAFTRDTVLRFPALPPTPLEGQERLEQLRALEHGIRIKVCDTERPVLEVNTPEDLEAAEQLVRERAASR